MKRLFKTSAVVVFVAVSYAPAQDSPANTGAAAYDDFVEPWRSRFIKHWEKEVESVKSYLAKKPKITPRSASIRTAKERNLTTEQIKAIRLKEARERAVRDRQAAKTRLEKLQNNDPPYFGGILQADGLGVGAYGRPEWIDAKVKQVIDGNQMLVGIEDARTGDSRYDTWIMLKCSTVGITDGKFWRGGQWKAVTGSELLVVTGTTTYPTAAGGTKTVFTIEPLRLDSLKKKK